MGARSKMVYVPGLGREVRFLDRHEMRKGHPTRRMRATAPLPPVTLPIDWAGNLSFPLDGNDRKGDCMYVAGCHADNTWTGNVGRESVFDEATLVADYEQLSGGDNGLDEGTLIKGWMAGLAGVPQATIIDTLDVDPLDANLCQNVVQDFGCLVFMLDVPDPWIQSFKPGCLWTGPVRADRNNGHGTLWNGVDPNGNYKLQTWGSYCWISPKGVASCDPSAFAAFSLRWFNANGIAPNGKTYAQLAALWQQLGGKALPPWQGPTPSPGPNPGPTPMPPTPTPTPVNPIWQELLSFVEYLLSTFGKAALPQIEMWLARIPGIPPEIVAMIDALLEKYVGQKARFRYL